MTSFPDSMDLRPHWPLFAGLAFIAASFGLAWVIGSFALVPSAVGGALLTRWLGSRMTFIIALVIGYGGAVVLTTLGLSLANPAN